MSEPFLIIDEILVPEPDFDGYHAWEDTLREQIPMISGRLVEEVRGKVWRINYTSDRMSDSETRRLLAALRAKGSKTVAFLPDNGDELIPSTFLVESLTPPVLAFFDGTEPVWKGLSFSLREVKPHA